MSSTTDQLHLPISTPAMLTSDLQAQLAPLADAIHTNRKQWWARVREVRNQEPSSLALPTKKQYKITKRKRSPPTPLDIFTHRLKWKISHIAARSKLLKRFGEKTLEFTLEQHIAMSLRRPKGTETLTNQLGNALRETDRRLNRWEKAIKESETRWSRRLRGLCESVRALDRGLRVNEAVGWCVVDVESLEKREVEVRCERGGDRRNLVSCERAREDMRVEFEIMGRLRRETLDVMRKMDELGVTLPGERQKMITEFFAKL